MQDRRIDNRLLCAELVEVTWESEGRQQRRVANLEDISLCGVCLQMEKPVPPSTKVTVRYGNGALMGTVRYCASHEMGFLIGIKLEDGTLWSTQHYKPQHLLDTRELLKTSLIRHCLTGTPQARTH